MCNDPRMRIAMTLLLVLSFVGLASAESDEAQRRAASLIQSTMSPFCPGKTLASCPSQKATEWREDIRSWVADGRSDDEILSSLQSRTPGFQLSATPDTQWSWWGPALVLVVLTAVFAWGMARAFRASGTRGPAAVAGASAADRDRAELERELRALD
jgi:cytochrome c-type biogenesis protein CcmH/NrfF